MSRISVIAPRCPSVWWRPQNVKSNEDSSLTLYKGMMSAIGT
jgi:hypothetical protein